MRIKLIFMSLTLFGCGCAFIVRNDPNVIVRQDISSINFGYTKDFVNFTDSYPFPKYIGDKDVGKAKEFYRSQLPLMLDRRLGVWESDELDFSDFSEWRGTKKLCLKVLSAADVRLELVRPDGSHATAPDSDGGFITSRTIFLGPKNSGLLFEYVMASNHIYSLFSPNGLQQRIRFVKKRPLNTEELVSAVFSNPKVASIINLVPGKHTKEKFPVPDDYFAAISGLYCDEDPFEEDRKTIEKSYIMINRHGDAFAFDKSPSDGLLHIDDFYRLPYFINKYFIDGSRYYFRGKDIVKTVSPMSPMEELEISVSYVKKFAAAGKIKYLNYKMDSYLRSHDERLIDWYEYPNTKRQSVYKKVPDIVFKEDDFAVGEYFSSETRKKFVDMLNNGKKFSDVFKNVGVDLGLSPFSY